MEWLDDKTIGVIIGALIGIIPTLISKFADERKEEKKWIREKKYSQEQKFKSQLGLTGKKLLKIQHAVNWICWMAAKSPEKVTIEQIGNYDSEVRQLFPEVMAELVEISIINNTAYEKLNIEFERIIKIDSSFSKIINQKIYQNKINIDKTEEFEGLLNEIISLRGDILKAIKDVVNISKKRAE